MKRYACTVATGLLLALMSTGTATATLIPLPDPTGQTGTQEATFGDQTAEQSNDANVTQKQGNGNLNIAPAIAVFGDAETTNAQGNGNTANANVDQSNSTDQSQSSGQKQSLDQDGGSCCDGQSQTGEQTADFGNQTAEQSNTADVDQWQGNGNVNVAPAIAVFGDAETTNAQGNGNEANADVTQSNDASQHQYATQEQYLDQDGGTCCGGQSQTGTQTAEFGDQTAEQSNSADVTQKQGNGNVNIAPAIAIFGDATTKNAQGNGNTANANVDQSNSADQSQASYQKQSLDQDGGTCCGGQSQTGTQTVEFGDQTVRQSNAADVDQWQGNGNLNFSPAIALGGKKHEPCRSECGKSTWKPSGGDATTTNYQGNGNEANAGVTQSNDASQHQYATQKQYLDQDGGSCCKPPVQCKKPDPCAPRKDHGAYEKGAYEKDGHSCCAGQSQTGEQTATFGHQTAEQSNSADVTQKQGNGNLNFSPAIALGGKKHEPCRSKCGKSTWKPSGGDAMTTNYQGNWNEANARVGQSNSADQSQASYQAQSLVDACKGLVYR
jgi:hypothetical protein